VKPASVFWSSKALNMCLSPLVGRPETGWVRDQTSKLNS
jgi:hypothetical protein